MINLSDFANFGELQIIFLGGRQMEVYAPGTKNPRYASDWIYSLKPSASSLLGGFTWFQLGSNWMCFSSKCPSWSYIVRRFKNCSFGTDNLSREKYSEITIFQNEQIHRYKFTLAAEIQKASSASVRHQNFSSRFYFELERFLHTFQNPKYANFD